MVFSSEKWLALLLVKQWTSLLMKRSKRRILSERKNFKNICVSKRLNKSRIIIFILTGVGALVGFFVGEAVDWFDSLKEIKEE